MGKLSLAAHKKNRPAFFEASTDGLPRFTGTSVAEHIEAWVTIARKEKRGQWHKAAIAASLVRAYGTRTDVEGETAIQRFCRVVGIGPAYCSRLARTYRTFAGPLDPEVKKLLDDDAICFKHALIAASCAVQPIVALREAKELGWSADHFARMLTARKGRELLDAADETPIRPENDSDDPEASAWQGAPDPRPELVARPPGTDRFVLKLTKRERREFGEHLRAVAAVLGTTSDHDTIIAMARRASAEWAPGTSATAAEDDADGQARLSDAGRAEARGQYYGRSRKHQDRSNRIIEVVAMDAANMTAAVDQVDFGQLDPSCIEEWVANVRNGGRQLLKLADTLQQQRTKTEQEPAA